MTTKILKQIITFAIASSTCTLGHSLSAEAASLVPGNITDSQFNQLMDDGQFTETFVTSARIGGAPTYELGLLDPQNNLLPDQQGEFNWVSGETVNFTLSYDGNKLDYTVGGQLLSTTTFSGSVTDLFLRTRAADNSSVSLNNLMLMDETGSLALGDTSSAGSGSSDVDYLQVADVTGAFTITGQSVMSWTGDQPRDSELIYQFKAGTSQPVPEPASLAAIALVGAAGLKLRRRAASS